MATFNAVRTLRGLGPQIIHSARKSEIWRPALEAPLPASIVPHPAPRTLESARKSVIYPSGRGWYMFSFDGMSSDKEEEEDPSEPSDSGGDVGGFSNWHL